MHDSNPPTNRNDHEKIDAHGMLTRFTPFESAIEKANKPRPATPKGPIDRSRIHGILAGVASSYKWGTRMPKVLDPYHRWPGIPPKDQPPNHYRLLGIERFEPDQEVIRDAAEQRMAHVRTYQLGQYSELSQKILNELAAAKACPLDPQKKAVDDRQSRALAGKLGAIEDAALPLPASRPALPEKRLVDQTSAAMECRKVGAADGNRRRDRVVGGGRWSRPRARAKSCRPEGGPCDRRQKAVQPQNTTPPQTKPVVPEAKGFAPQPANSPVAVQPRPGRTPPDAAVQPRSDAGRQPTAEQSPPLPPDSREEPQEEPQSEPEKPKVAARKQPKKKPAATHAAKNGSLRRQRQDAKPERRSPALAADHAAFAFPRHSDGVDAQCSQETGKTRSSPKRQTSSLVWTTAAS